MKPRRSVITPNSHNRIDKLQREIHDLQRAPLTYEVVVTPDLTLNLGVKKSKRKAGTTRTL